MEAPGKKKDEFRRKGGCWHNYKLQGGQAAHAGYTLSLVGILEGNPG